MHVFCSEKKKKKKISSVIFQRRDHHQLPYIQYSLSLSFNNIREDRLKLNLIILHMPTHHDQAIGKVKQIDIHSV